jgi:transcription elongation factor GreA
MADDPQQQYLTQEKFDELKKELEYLTTVRRKEIAENLEYARSLGDLSENAEYQEARELQAATEERIRRLEALLKSAKIASDTTKGTVGFGSTVVIQKVGEKEQRTYQIVGSEEANMLERKISHLSPLGEALMGRKKGDVFSFKTPTGAQEYKVIAIS